MRAQETGDRNDKPRTVAGVQGGAKDEKIRCLGNRHWCVVVVAMVLSFVRMKLHGG